MTASGPCAGGSSSMRRTARSGLSSSGAVLRQTMGRQSCAERGGALILSATLIRTLTLIRWYMTWGGAAKARTAATPILCPTSSRWTNSWRRAGGHRGKTRRLPLPPLRILHVLHSFHPCSETTALRTRCTPPHPLHPCAPLRTLPCTPLLTPAHPCAPLRIPAHPCAPLPPDAHCQVLLEAVPRLPADRRQLSPSRTQARPARLTCGPFLSPPLAGYLAAPSCLSCLSGLSGLSGLPGLPTGPTSSVQPPSLRPCHTP